MYGFVNSAIRQYVIEQDGEAAWKDIVAQAELDTPEFDVTISYEDSTTITLVSAIASARGCEAAAILKDIGRYWLDLLDARRARRLRVSPTSGVEQI